MTLSTASVTMALDLPPALAHERRQLVFSRLDGKPTARYVTRVSLVRDRAGITKQNAPTVCPVIPATLALECEPAVEFGRVNLG